MRALPRVVAEPSDRPQVGGPDHPMRLLTRAVAFEAGSWSPTRAAEVVALFDGLAPDWDARTDAHEMALPVEDALARGGPFGARWVEVGAGTGRATAVVAGARPGSPPVVAVDVSPAMLQRLDPTVGHRVRGDSAALPVRDGAADVVLAVNAFLFPAEVERALAPGGALLWVNTLGDWTPIHLPPGDVVAALPGAWDGVWAHAGWGTWTVVRRAGR